MIDAAAQIPGDLSMDALRSIERRLEAENQKRLVRRSLADWARYRGFEPAKHHLLIIRAIEDFLRSDDLDVLLLHAPPGSAKSTYVSWLLPSWYLANFPQSSILFATHNVEFAQRWGRRVRNDIQIDGPTLGISMSADNAASDRWAIEQGGEYYAVGAGVGISGFRADLGLCDDLFGSREDAWSETVRQKRWDWYVDDFSARLKPRGKRILMNTRWHEEDIAGRSIKQIEDGTVRGKILTIPARAEDNEDPLGREPGEYLWDEPDGYGYGNYLRAREKETSPMMWSALFQQRPAPQEGEYFKAEWLKPYVKAPPRSEMRIYGASDYAVTSGGGDWTVHGVFGIDSEGKPYLLDLWRKQASSDVWVEAFCDLVIKWKPIEWAEEQGQIKSGVGPFLSRRQREKFAYVVRTPFPTRGDKSVRAQSFRGYIAQHGLYVPEHAPWYPAFRSELMSFPAGKHDDQVDMAGLFGQLLDKVLAGFVVRPTVKPKRDAWDRAFDKEFADDDEVLDWKVM